MRSPKSRIQDLLPNDLFVGRRQELRKLTVGLEKAITGQSWLFLIEGEAGIGKTRLAQELAGHARKHNVSVLWGRCYEDQGVPPYWPWIEAIRSYVSKHDRKQLQHELGAGAGDIAEIVPEVREILPDAEAPVSLEPMEARFRLFDSIKAFIKRASNNQPLLLILDNLHCADRSSLRLLEIMAQELSEMRLMIVFTYRNIKLSRLHPLAETLGELSRHPHFQHLYLENLTLHDVEQFV